MAVELRNSDRLPAPRGYSHASIAPAGRMVHLAGQIGTDEDGTLVSGLAEQTERSLRNLVEALAAAGGTPDDLVKINIFVVGWTESKQGELFAGIAAAGAVDPLPLVPITLLGVQSLYLDDALVEIEAVAALTG